jgi:hypothetical protein
MITMKVIASVVAGNAFMAIFILGGFLLCTWQTRYYAQLSELL